MKSKDKMTGNQFSGRPRDPKRIKRILGLLEKTWTTSPDMRFGQLLINLRIAPDNLGFYNVEDDEIEGTLQDFRGWEAMGTEKLAGLREMRDDCKLILDRVNRDREQVIARIGELELQIKKAGHGH